MAGAASDHQAAIASREETSQQRADRTRRTSADPQRAQQGATAAATASSAALDSLSRLQQLADASPRVAQLQRLQALADERFAPVAQLAGDPEEEELVQGKFASSEVQPQRQKTPRANNRGLPDQLKSGIESLSGLSMDHVRVHDNSLQPAQLNALAYAQGSAIHLAPGQERDLPHEAWPVVQQAQGRAKPTRQMKGGVLVNDDVGLEREADLSGAPAAHGWGGTGKHCRQGEQAELCGQVAGLQQTRDDCPAQGRQRYWNPFHLQRQEAPTKPNNSGRPDDLKNGIESLSGISKVAMPNLERDNHAGRDFAEAPRAIERDDPSMLAASGLPRAVIQRKLAARLQHRAEAQAQAGKGAGEPLPSAVHAPMEASFGTDFSDVRAHHDGVAEAHGALALAQGNDFHFATGQFDPSSASGRQVIGHELAHVVQQRAGRVAVPQGLGAPVNAEEGLEAEADRMGAAAARGARVSMPGAGAGGAGAATAPIQHLKIKQDGEKYVEAKEGDSKICDTLRLSRDRRKELVKALKTSGDKKLLEAIQKEWRDERAPSKLEEASDLSIISKVIELSGEVETLEQMKLERGKGFSKNSKERVTEIGSQLKEMMDMINDSGTEGMELARKPVRDLLGRVGKLDGDEKLVDYGAVLAGGGEVTDRDREAYRADILQMGTWGGLGEAGAVAVRNDITFAIYVIAHGRYQVAVPRVGNGRNPSNRVLLHLGNHYVVMNAGDVVGGQQAPEELPVVARTETSGDCLYEGIYILMNGRKPANYESAIQALRQQAHDGMNVDAVDASVLLVRSGSTGGLGANMRQLLGVQTMSRTYESRLEKLVNYQGWNNHKDLIGNLVIKFKQAEKENPLSEKAITALNVLKLALDKAEQELAPKEEWENPKSVPSTLYRYVSTEAAKDAIKNGITYHDSGGGIPTSTKSDMSVARKSGAIFLNKLLIIDTSKIPSFKFEYVPTRSKLKEVKIKCNVPAEAIQRG